MDAFKKCPVQPYLADSVGTFVVPTYDTVSTVDSLGNETKHLELKKLDVKDLAKRTTSVTRTQYDLESQLKLGQLPREVNVSGLIDSGEPDVIGTFERLKEMENNTSVISPSVSSEPSNV